MNLGYFLFSFAVFLTSATAIAKEDVRQPASPDIAVVQSMPSVPQGRSPTLRLSPGFDTGADRHDGLTNKNELRLNGRALPRSTVVLVDKRNREIARLTVPDDWHYEFRLPRLADGKYEFSAVQLVTKDTGYFSSPLEVTIDTAPPPEPKFTMLTDAILMDRLASFAGRASPDTVRAELMLGSKRLETAYWIQEKFRFTNIRLSPGYRQLHVHLIDRAGNQMDSKPIDVYVVQAREGQILKQLDGTDGFRLRRGTPKSLTGFSLSPTGDVNDDGIDDILIGAPADHDEIGEYGGRAYVKFGSRKKFQSDVTLTEMLPSEGFVIESEKRNAAFGYSVAGIGDFNNDGIDDVAIGDPLFGNAKNPTGAVYVVFGTRTPRDQPVRMAELDGVVGFKLVGEPGDNVGGSISGGYDFNGDGIDDLVVGAGGGASAQPRPVYVVYGRRTAFPSAASLGELTTTEGFRVTGRGDAFGYSVALGPDVSSDGLADIVISEPSSGEGRTGPNRGSVHVLFGGKRNERRLSVPGMRKSDGVSIKATFSNRLFEGFRIGAVTSGHDVNGDGLGDIVVSASFNRGQTRRIGGFVIFGGGSNHLDKIDFAHLDGKDGFRIEYTRERSELSTIYDTIGDDVLSGIADSNDDGVDDIIMSTNGEWQVPAAETFVMYGSRNPYPAVLYVDTLGNEDGMTMRGQRGDVGFSAAGAGDFNADGIGDIMIGAPTAGSDDLPETGEVYVVFGERRRKSDPD
jgi:hypothetical protein